MPTEFDFVRTVYTNSLDVPGAFSVFQTGHAGRVIDYGAGRFVDPGGGSGDLNDWEDVSVTGSSGQIYAPAIEGVIDASGDSARIYLSKDAFSGVAAVAVSDGDQGKVAKALIC